MVPVKLALLGLSRPDPDSESQLELRLEVAGPGLPNSDLAPTASVTVNGLA